MIPELGHFALILALAVTLVQITFPLIGAALNIPNWMNVAKPAAFGQFLFITIAYGCLTYAFVYNDFSVIYVANNSNSTLPMIYRVSSVWGGHEGSLLLWTLMLSLWTIGVAFSLRRLPKIVGTRVLAVMGCVSLGFLSFMLLTSNPFERISPAPVDGNDLNPLLQDPGLIFHPPLLYMGYVGFSVAFGFAIAGLLGGKLDSAWVRWSRPWTLMAWVFLTLGIALGSWWAYYELGWGGWWFWDPVENASFMPWLIGTALIHSLAVTEKRGAFKNWTVLLAILAFSLSLLGTFLVRSGVLTSVHAFAADPERGISILIFLGIVIGFSLLLYAWRAPHIGKGGNFSLISRETLLLLNNVLLVVAAASVLLGTLYPLVLDALGMGKISVGPPYFDKVFFWIMVPLMLALGLASLARWKEDKIASILPKAGILLVASLLLAVAIPFLFIGKSGFVLIPGVTATFWIVLTTIYLVKERLRHQSNMRLGFSRLPLSFHGMLLAHIGLAVSIVGITITNAFSIEKDARVEPQKPIEVSGYTFIFEGTEAIEGPNYHAEKGTVRVLRGEQLITTLYPQKRVYRVRSMPMTEAAIDPGFTKDIYVALGEPLDGKAWSMRVYYKPFIRWIWLGALLMALGGLLSISDKRYRYSLRANTQPQT